MKRFIEVTVTLREKSPIGYATHKHKRLIDLNSVSTIYEGSENIIKFDDGAWISVSTESYDAVRDALLKGDALENGGTVGKMRSCIEELEEHRNLADKLCELQNDHSWAIRAMHNLLLCLRNPKDIEPSVLLDVNDGDLRALFETCCDEAKHLCTRISELEEEVKIMTEPKKPQ